MGTANIRQLLFAAVLLSACTNNSLVVVTVDALPVLSNIRVLHTTSIAGGQTHDHDIASAMPFSLGGGITKTFGVEVPQSIDGSFVIHVEARDSTGTPMGRGDGMTQLAAGKRTDLSITLGAAVPLVASEPVWIGWEAPLRLPCVS